MRRRVYIYRITGTFGAPEIRLYDLDGRYQGRLRRASLLDPVAVPVWTPEEIQELHGPHALED